MGVKYSEFYMKNPLKLQIGPHTKLTGQTATAKNLLIGSGDFTLTRYPWDYFQK